MYETINYKFVIYVIGKLEHKTYVPPALDQDDQQNNPAGKTDNDNQSTPKESVDDEKKHEIERMLYQSSHQIKYLLNEPYLKDTPFFIVINIDTHDGNTAQKNDESNDVLNKARMYAKMLEIEKIARISDGSKSWKKVDEISQLLENKFSSAVNSQPNAPKDKYNKEKKEETFEQEMEKGIVYFSLVECRERDGVYGIINFRHMLYEQLINLGILVNDKAAD